MYLGGGLCVRVTLQDVSDHGSIALLHSPVQSRLIVLSETWDRVVKKKEKVKQDIFALFLFNILPVHRSMANLHTSFDFVLIKQDLFQK